MCLYCFTLSVSIRKSVLEVEFGQDCPQCQPFCLLSEPFFFYMSEKNLFFVIISLIYLSPIIYVKYQIHFLVTLYMLCSVSCHFRTIFSTCILALCKQTYDTCKILGTFFLFSLYMFGVMYVCLCVCSLSVYFLESFLNFLIHLAEFLCSVPSPKTTHSQCIMHMSVKYPCK